MKIEYRLEIELDTEQNVKFVEKIKEFINNNIMDAKTDSNYGEYGEIQEAVMDELDFDNDIGFEDVGVKMKGYWMKE